MAPEQQRRILDRARERPDLVERRGERHEAVAGNQAVGRLETHDAAERRGLADRAAGVGAERQRRLAGRDGRGRAAGAAARHPREIPGIGGGLKGRVLRRGTHRKLIHVEPAPQHRPGVLEPARDRGVVGRDEVRQHPAGARQRLAGHGDDVLEADRNAVERSPHLPRRAARVGGAGLGQRVGLVEGIERLHPVLHRPGAGDERRRELDGRDSPCLEQRGEFGRGLEDEIGRHSGMALAEADGAAERSGLPSLPPVQVDDSFDDDGDHDHVVALGRRVPERGFHRQRGLAARRPPTRWQSGTRGPSARPATTSTCLSFSI